MSNLPVIAGMYADLRQVKTRGVWQLVVDVPSADAERLVETFGLPRQDEPTWLAVARLTVSPEAATTASASPNTGERPSKAADDTGASPQNKAGVASGGSKRERTLPEKVGMRCNDTRFQRWLSTKGLGIVFNNERTAEYVRTLCKVKSRAEITPDNVLAAKTWRDLETQFLEDTGQMAEERR